MRRFLSHSLAVSLILVPTIAAAHVPFGEARDVFHGLVHPMLGLDHLLAAIAVGLLAVRLGGRAVWQLPLSFAGTMAAAGLFAMTGINPSFVEAGIALSLIALGAGIAIRVTPPAAAATAVVGFFAIFHGFAHGAEMPATMSGFSYGFGLVTATLTLHGFGIGLGILCRKADTLLVNLAWRFAGGIVSLFGTALLVQLA